MRESDPLDWVAKAEGDLDMARRALRGSVDVRYPGEEPSLEEARQAIGIAKTVRAFARRWLGLNR